MLEDENKYSYKLPSPDGQIEEYKTNYNSLILIGANGSGKSKLGAWIEDQNPENVHRIGAQRNLNFKQNIPLTNYDDAKNRIFYGTNDEDIVKNHNKGSRWNWEKSNTTMLLEDFDVVLAALIAMHNNETNNYFNECKDAEKADRNKPNTPNSIMEKLMDIWDSIFPQRCLLFEDSKFFAYEYNKPFEKYSANQMSDGERAVLYLASQVLAIPGNKTLIIDEPEIHLHNSIMNKLWEKLESFRPDCFFIYITHDTNFAASHGLSDKIWIKEFDGNKWKLEKLDKNQLPEKLLFEILGARKNVLFVEGENNSLDTKLYSLIYPNYLIIPCGSCEQVILRTKAFNSTTSIHKYKVYGLIDRDFRTENEIEKLKQDNIYVLNVAEVENLFLVEELIKNLTNSFGTDFDSVFSKVKNYVIIDRLKNRIQSQVNKCVVAEIKYKLSTTDINEMNIKDSLKNIINDINIEQIYQDKFSVFNKLLESENYKEILKIFNEKGLAKSIGHFFGIINDRYIEIVIFILRKTKHEEIVKIFQDYIPDNIPPTA